MNGESAAKKTRNHTDKCTSLNLANHCNATASRPRTATARTQPNRHSIRSQHTVTAHCQPTSHNHSTHTATPLQHMVTAHTTHSNGMSQHTVTTHCTSTYRGRARARTSGSLGRARAVGVPPAPPCTAPTNEDIVSTQNVVVHGLVHGLLVPEAPVRAPQRNKQPKVCQSARKTEQRDADPVIQHCGDGVGCMKRAQQPGLTMSF